MKKKKLEYFGKHFEFFVLNMAHRMSEKQKLEKKLKKKGIKV